MFRINTQNPHQLQEIQQQRFRNPLQDKCSIAILPTASSCVEWCVELLNTVVFKVSESRFNLRKDVSATNFLSPVSLSNVHSMDLQRPCTLLRLVAQAVVDISIREEDQVFVLVTRRKSLKKKSLIERRVERICDQGSRG
jgi:hypothetical protein